MPLNIIRANIVHMRTDAIVNAANEALSPEGGVCGDIYANAGYDDMLRACRAIGHVETGDAAVTSGFRLPAKYVIHAACPAWRGGAHGEEALLRACYASAMRIAAEKRLSSIAFPLLSYGARGLPRAKALSVAVSEISACLMRLDTEQELCAYIAICAIDDYKPSGKLFSDIQSYLGENSIDARVACASMRSMQSAAPFIEARADETFGLEFDKTRAVMDAEYIKRDMAFDLPRDEDTFQQRVLRLIDESRRSDVDVYKKANLNRKLFSKLRGDKHYQPSKKTALALAISLKLSMPQVTDLLMRAGYALSPCNRMDMIISYFIERGAGDIHTINMALFELGEECL